MSPRKFTLLLCTILLTSITVFGQMPSRSLQKPDGNNGLTNNGDTFFYGFDDIVDNPSQCDLDNNGLADFGGATAPDFDIANKLATDIDKNGAECLLITRTAGSIWKTALENVDDWTIECHVNILDDASSQGSGGVFGLFLADGNSATASLKIKRDGFGTIFNQSMNNTGWHTFRIAKNADGFWFWRDGQLLNTDDNSPIAPGNDSRFELFAGDFSSTLAGNWEIDYFAIDNSGAYSPWAINIELTDGETVVGETPGSSDTYNIVLPEAANEDVIITATPTGENADDINLGNGPGQPIDAVIATGELSTTITITAIDDSQSEGPETVTITNLVSSNAINYNGQLPAVDVTIEDNEAYCGDANTVYLSADLNKDCYVNLMDMSILAIQWLGCTDPTNNNCYSNIPPAEPIHTAVFIPSQGGYPNYRIPAIVVSNTGTILAFCEGRQGGDASQNDIILRRSFDNGLTWTPTQLIAEDGINNLNNPQAVVLDNGRIIIMWQHFTYGHHEHGVMPGHVTDPANDIYTCLNFVSYSDDDGATWSTPIENTSEVKRWAGSMTASTENPTSIAGGPGIGFVKRHEPNKGRIIMPYNQGPFGNWRVYAAYSDNGGDTWSYGDYAADPTTGGHGNEVQMVELSDGTLMINSRHYGGANSRRIAYSNDGGQTWNALVNEPQLLDGGGGCMASIVTLSDAADNVPNRILFAGPDAGNRSNGTVHISYDDANTWAMKKTIVSGSYAYSCLTVLADDSIGLLYESGGQVKFASFTLRWLTDNQDWIGKTK